MADRFWEKVVKTDGCWLWVGARKASGHGTFWISKEAGFQVAHRWAWIDANGPVPQGLELDHLCRNPPCVRPDHLEPVTHAVNLGRSPLTLGVRNAAKTHCPQGHEYTPENTIIRRGRNGGRRCRECTRRQKAAQYQRKRNAA